MISSKEKHQENLNNNPSIENFKNYNIYLEYDRYSN